MRTVKTLQSNGERRARRDRRSQSDMTEFRFAASIGAEREIVERVYGEFSGVEGLVHAILQRDPFTREHLVHTNGLAQRFAERLGLDAAQRLVFVRAALLHDLGKIGIAESILIKPARLEPDEYELVQRHAEIGRSILAPYRAYARVAVIVGQHHERFDGMGYPHGLKGNELDPLARALSVIDTFSAMTLHRPYHFGVREDVALREIEDCAGTQFDPYYARLFVSMITDLRSAAALAGAMV